MKQSELLGGAGDVLANSRADPYLSQGGAGSAVWSFPARRLRCGDQRAEPAAAYWQPAKRRPEHASLGVLRSPDIPSILVETGFISNNGEERLLGSDDYRSRLRRRFITAYATAMQHPLRSAPRSEAAQTASAAAPGGMLIN